MGTPRLSAGPRLERQSQITADRHTDPDAHETAMDRLLARDTPAIAREVGLARRTVQSWRDRDGEHRGPGRLLALTVRAAVRFGRSIETALGPVIAIADEWGFDLVGRATASGDRIGLVDAMAAVLGEAADVVEALRVTTADQRLTSQELAVVKQQCRELRAAVDAVEAEAEAIFAGGPRAVGAPRRTASP